LVCLTKHKGDEGIVGHKTPLNGDLVVSLWQSEPTITSTSINYWKLEDLKSAMGPYWRQYKSSVCFFFFSHTTHLPVQDISGDAHTHLDAAQTHFGSCYALYTSLQAQNVHNMGLNCVWASSIFFGEKEGLGQGQTRKIKKQAVLFSFFFFNVKIILANFDPKISKISQNYTRHEIQILTNFFVEKWKIFTRKTKKNCGTFVLPTIRIHSQFNLFHLLGLSYAWMLTQVRLGFTLVAYAV
jgi:hypothetical protein